MEQHPAAAPAPANNTPAGGAPEGSPAETANSQPSSLHQLLQALDRKVRERTQELETARTQIEHSAQAHRTLLGRLDQELLQPISLISFEAERLLQSPLDGLNEDQRARLKRIQQASAESMHRLRAIVAPNRPSSAEQPMRIQPASIRTIVEASLRAVRDAALAKNVQIALRNDTQSDLIQADARLVKQILVQAADYCVRQAGAGATVKVELRSISEGQIIECTIATTMSTSGTSSSDMDAHFAQQRQIAQQHGGQFMATTAEGNTISLALRLPVDGPAPSPSPDVAAPHQAPAPSHATPPQEPHTPLVLLADDHPVNLKLYGNLLQHVGYRSLVAHTGAEAIQLATSHRPDLILMDIQMPDLDGIEATSQIAHAPQTAGIPIICITSFAMPQDRERCFAAGARAYFCKPVNLGQLSKVMADLLKFPAGAPSARTGS